MRHDVYVEWPDKKEEIRHLDFVCYGKNCKNCIPLIAGKRLPGTIAYVKTAILNLGDGTPDGYSAMAKTVGYPCAIAAKMVLTGEIQDKGMVVPMAQHIYR